MTRILALAAVAVAYIVTGKISLSLAFVNESTSAVWPPAGIAAAAALLAGARVWPAIAIGAFAVNVTTSGHLVASLAIAAGNTAEALAAAWLMQRFASGRAAFERTPDIARFAAAALAASAVAATIGTSALVATGLASQAEAAAVWLTWWVGDSSGIVLIAPLIVLWAAPGGQRWTRLRAMEAAVLAVLLAGAAAVIFGESRIAAAHAQLQFLTVPFLLWAAFRFGGRETAVAALIVAVFATRGTLQGLGPFAPSGPSQGLLILAGFITVITLVVLSVAAEVAARGRVEAEMRSLNEALEARVAARTEELTRVHNRLVEAQRVAHVGSWEWDVTTNALWWSDELWRIYGLDAGEPIGYEKFLACVHPDDRAAVEGAVGQALGDGRTFAVDHRIVRPDGAVRVLHGQGRVVTGPDGRAVRMVGTGHDITERVAAEEQRAQLKLAEAARQDAETANRAKDHFLATLSHELRTPLNVALGWAHMLASAPLDARAVRAADAIARNLRMLARLVSDIVDASRIAAGAMALELTEVDVAALVHDAVDAVRGAAGTRGISVDVSIRSPLPPLTGDVDRLQQVLWNLLSNAVKFTPAGGQVQVAVQWQLDGVVILVEDNGPGIDPSFLPHVFDQFRQGDALMTREHGGLGLGLAIAKHLVTLHGGSITAGNREEGGAMFSVRLPVQAAAPT